MTTAAQPDASPSPPAPANTDAPLTSTTPATQPADATGTPSVPGPTAPLRLEWIAAGTLTENQANWRRHPPEQMRALKELLDDPSVGWAGACLYNERTGRLIDGHARKAAVDPATPVPVLVGNWTEDAERKILATLDPLAALATGDAAAYRALFEHVNADGLWVRDLLDSTLRRLDAAAVDDTPDPEQPAAAAPDLPAMACQPFEHHDFVMLVFHDDQDFQAACEKLGIKKVAVTYPGGTCTKVGLGRVIDGARAIRILEGKEAQK